MFLKNSLTQNSKLLPQKVSFWASTFFVPPFQRWSHSSWSWGNIKCYPVPNNTAAVNTFLGLCSYYRNYVIVLAKVARPIYQLTEKPKAFLWNSNSGKAFDILKVGLNSAPYLAFPSRKKLMKLYNEASQLAMGAALAQVQNGSERLVCYASQSSSKFQSRCCTTKRELFAIVKLRIHIKLFSKEEVSKLSLITELCSGLKGSKTRMVQLPSDLKD